MSTRVVICCDDCGALRTDLYGMTAGEARDKLEAEGWGQRSEWRGRRLITTADFCPECARLRREREAGR